MYVYMLFSNQIKEVILIGQKIATENKVQSQTEANFTASRFQVSLVIVTP